MQFTVWRYSGKSRVIFEFIVTFIIAVIMYNFVKQSLNLKEEIIFRVNNIVNLENILLANANQ